MLVKDVWAGQAALGFKAEFLHMGGVLDFKQLLWLDGQNKTSSQEGIR